MTSDDSVLLKAVDPGRWASLIKREYIYSLRERERDRDRDREGAQILSRQSRTTRKKNGKWYFLDYKLPRPQHPTRIFFIQELTLAPHTYLPRADTG